MTVTFLVMMVHAIFSQDNEQSFIINGIKVIYKDLNPHVNYCDRDKNVKYGQAYTDDPLYDHSIGIDIECSTPYRDPVTIAHELAHIDFFEKYIKGMIAPELFEQQDKLYDLMKEQGIQSHVEHHAARLMIQYNNGFLETLSDPTSSKRERHIGYLNTYNSFGELLAESPNELDNTTLELIQTTHDITEIKSELIHINEFYAQAAGKNMAMRLISQLGTWEEISKSPQKSAAARYYIDEMIGEFDGQMDEFDHIAANPDHLALATQLFWNNQPNMVQSMKDISSCWKALKSEESLHSSYIYPYVIDPIGTMHSLSSILPECKTQSYSSLP
jgi:hypothetical protein